MSIFDDGYNLDPEQNQLVEQELIPILVQLAEGEIEPYYVVENYFQDVNKFYCWGAARYRVRYFRERKIHSWLVVIQSVPEKIAIRGHENFKKLELVRTVREKNRTRTRLF